MCAVKKAVSVTHARLIEDWVVDILQQYEQVMGRPVPLPIPIRNIAERLFALRCDEENLKGSFASALAVLIPQKRWLLLNKTQGLKRLSFTIAHELAHWLINAQKPIQGNHSLEFITGLRTNNKRTREQRANYVAAALLMPKQILLNEIRRLRDSDRSDLDTLSKVFGVSHRAMEVRLDQLDCTFDGMGIGLPLSPTEDGRRGPIRYQYRSKNVSTYTPAIIAVEIGHCLIDHTLYREFLSLKRRCDSLYLLLTSDNADSIDVLLEWDCVDGFAIPKGTLGWDPGEQTFDVIHDDVIFYPLESGRWINRIVQDESTIAYEDKMGACVVFPRKDGQFGSKQQTLLDPSRYVVPAMRLNYRKYAREFIKSAKQAGRRVAVVTGCFDLITTNHVRFLKRAKEAGDVLVVGLEDDTRIRGFKGPLRPVNTISQRVELMNAFGFVDFVFVISGSPKSEIKPFYTRLHRMLSADVLVVTEDDPHLQDRKDEIEAAGGELLVIKRFEGNSTTSLIRQFLAGTEISDLLLVPKRRIKACVAEGAAEEQACWRQLRLPLDGFVMES